MSGILATRDVRNLSQQWGVPSADAACIISSSGQSPITLRMGSFEHARNYTCASAFGVSDEPQMAARRNAAAFALCGPHAFCSHAFAGGRTLGGAFAGA